MPEEKLKGNEPSPSVWQWLQNKIVQTVPEGYVVCGFDCRKCQCTQGEWETCARRLSKAAGETVPLPAKDLQVTGKIRTTEPSTSRALSTQWPGEQKRDAI